LCARNVAADKVDLIEAWITWFGGLSISAGLCQGCYTVAAYEGSITGHANLHGGASKMNESPGFLMRYFGVVAREETYLNLIYLMLAFPLSIVYFTFLVTGLSVGFGTLIIWIGIPITSRRHTTHGPRRGRNSRRLGAGKGASSEPRNMDKPRVPDS
jgi:hypothetical protein